MFESVSRGWKMVSKSFSILKEDKKLLLFPLLSGFFSILLLIGFLAPLFVAGLLSQSEQALGQALFYVVLFAYYVCTSFLAIFFNTALVHSLKTKIEGKDESLGASIGFAFSRFLVILEWALVSATIGLILNAIEGALSKNRGGQLVASIIRAIIGFAWAILTFFVVPVFVYENLGFIASLKKSAETFRKTWGESFVANFSTGFIFAILTFLWVVLSIVLVVAVIPLSPVLLIPVAIIAVLGFLLIVLTSAAITNIYQTLLYLYASEGVVAPGFTEEEMRGLFRK